jgi:hypothetical protein
MNNKCLKFYEWTFYIIIIVGTIYTVASNKIVLKVKPKTMKLVLLPHCEKHSIKGINQNIYPQNVVSVR